MVIICRLAHRTLGGAPTVPRGISSLLAFAVGAVVVVLPFMFGSVLAVPVTIVSAGTALLLVGATIGLLNGRSALRCGARQLFIGGGAALLVFMLGHLAGARAGA